ncbi:MAG: hypothetical protein ABII79_14485 [bacterium]
MTRMVTLTVTLIIAVLALASLATAEVPQAISYQGRLLNSGGTAYNGPVLMKFIIWNDPSASAPANEKWNSAFQTVQVDNGLFEVLLGVPPQPALDHDLFTDTLRWLGITVDTDPEMIPRTKLVSASYAYHALRSDTAGLAQDATNLGTQPPAYYLDWGNITGMPAGFADGVDNEGTGDIEAVNAGSGLSGGGTSGPVTLNVTTNGITANHIATDAVDTDEIAPDAVGSSEVDNNSLTANDLATNSVNADEIATGAVGTDEVADNSLTTNDLAPNSVGTSEVVDNSLTANDLATDAVGASELAANSVYSGDIMDGEIIDADISTTANIQPTKVNGTAATRTKVNHFTADNFFDPPTNVRIGDSTFRANNSGVRIGDDEAPSSLYLLRIERKYNTSITRYAQSIDMDNTGDGTLYGMYSNVGSSSYGPGAAYGLYTNVNNNITGGGDRYGVRAYVGQSSNISGDSYGVRASVYGGMGTSVYAIMGTSFGTGAVSYAGYFSGNVGVFGTLTKTGGSFKIDHPLDPEHKYLQHSFVESPDMMNIYNGNVTLDADGQATVTMPDYFETLNMDFRYQLTCIGGFAPVYIAEKINGNQFRIAGGEAFGEVSWQVTGIRNDKWAQAHRIQVEVDKPTTEIGTYLNPEEHGQPIEKHFNYERMKEDLERAEGRGALNEESE